jgi:hypothetical protein
MAEEIPTRPPPAKPVHKPWTPEQQAQHVADLLNALDGWHWQDPTRTSSQRLHLIRDTNAA